MDVIELGPIWENILKLTRGRMNEQLWENSIHSGLLPISLENDILTLGVMQNYLKNFIEKNPIIYDILKSCAQQSCGYEVNLNIISLTENNENEDASEKIDEPPIFTTNIYSSNKTDSTLNIPIYDDPIIINTQKNNPFEDLPSVEDVYIPHPPINQIQPYNNEKIVQPLIDLSESTLNPQYTFETFVNGNSNRIAYAVAKNVAEHPADRYNPLFIYGQSGLGKTHLMHAIGNEIINRYPHMKVMCITSEKFTNIFINSIKDKQSESFRTKFRNIDVLLVDDIQFLQNKESTQEEFFHTFNALYEDKKQIILTSDILPKDLKDMEKRLRSRFEAGYIATIETPDLETRIAILRSIIDKESVDNSLVQIPNDVINYIANQFDENVRSLQGALKKLLGSMALEPPTTVIDIDYARKELAKLIDKKDTPYLSITYIQDFISDYFKIKKSDLLGQKRNKQFAYPRQIAMYLCRELVNESYPQISLAFGKKDHTTTLHAYDKINKEISQNSETKRIIEDIIKKLLSDC